MKQFGVMILALAFGLTAFGEGPVLAEGDYLAPVVPVVPVVPVIPVVPTIRPIPTVPIEQIKLMQPSYPSQLVQPSSPGQQPVSASGPSDAWSERWWDSDPGTGELGTAIKDAIGAVPNTGGMDYPDDVGNGSYGGGELIQEPLQEARFTKPLVEKGMEDQDSGLGDFEDWESLIPGSGDNKIGGAPSGGDPWGANSSGGDSSGGDLFGGNPFSGNPWNDPIEGNEYGSNAWGPGGLWDWNSSGGNSASAAGGMGSGGLEDLFGPGAKGPGWGQEAQGGGGGSSGGNSDAFQGATAQASATVSSGDGSSADGSSADGSSADGSSAGGQVGADSSWLFDFVTNHLAKDPLSDTPADINDAIGREYELMQMDLELQGITLMDPLIVEAEGFEPIVVTRTGTNQPNAAPDDGGADSSTVGTQLQWQRINQQYNPDLISNYPDSEGQEGHTAGGGPLRIRELYEGQWKRLGDEPLVLKQIWKISGEEVMDTPAHDTVSVIPITVP